LRRHAARTADCQLQAWVGPDEDHRIASGKMADILNKASSFLPGDDLPLEIEYETSRFRSIPVAEALVSDDAVTSATDDKTHRVLAPELCIPAACRFRFRPAAAAHRRCG
jgi:hypothetical protein